MQQESWVIQSLEAQMQPMSMELQPVVVRPLPTQACWSTCQ